MLLPKTIQLNARHGREAHGNTSTTPCVSIGTDHSTQMGSESYSFSRVTRIYITLRITAFIDVELTSNEVGCYAVFIGLFDVSCGFEY